MGCDISKKKVNGSIVLELNKQDKNQSPDLFQGGEIFNVQIHYCLDKPDINIILKHYAIVEIIVKDQVQKKIILSGSNHIIQPNAPVGVKQYEHTEQFQSQCPQIASTIVQTENPYKQIRITNYLEASFINQKNQELKPKISQVLQMNIRRSFEFPSTFITKTFNLPLKSWKWGDFQYAVVSYCFQDRQFLAGNVIEFSLFVDNTKPTITIDNIKIFLAFEILEKKDRRWNVLSRQIMWSSTTNQRICFGTNPPGLKFEILIPPGCVSSLYHFDFQMQYHVEIVFENEYNFFQKNSYTERILVDVVK